MARRSAYRAAMTAAVQRLAAPAVPVADLAYGADGIRGTVRFAHYGSGPPVLVLHGSGGGWDQGVDWANRRLAPHTPPGFTVISPSRFGYPGSSLPSGVGVPEQAGVLVQLLDHLAVDHVDVVGLSAGSVAALQLAADHPHRVRRLVLESPLLPLAGRAPLPPVAAVKLLARAEFLLWAATRLPPVVTLAAGAPPRQLSGADRSELAEINATMFPLRPRRDGTVFDRQVSAAHLLADRIPLEQIMAPTLVVNAAHAQLTPPADAARFVSRVAGAQLLEIDHGGHVLIGNITTLRAAITEFLTA